MFGTIVNAAAIVLGGLIGLAAGNKLPERFRQITTVAVGLSVLGIGLAAAVAGLNNPSANPVLFLISLALGGLIGEGLKLDKRLEALGDFAARKLGGKSDFSRGFVSATVLFCVGTMAILGAIQSGAEGNHRLLYVKAALDGVTAVVLAAGFGAGVILSAAAVLVYQGAIALAARGLSPFLSENLLLEISIVGGLLIAAIGIDMLGVKQIKTINLLPAILVPPLYEIVTAII